MKRTKGVYAVLASIGFLTHCGVKNHRADVPGQNESGLSSIKINLPDKSKDFKDATTEGLAKMNGYSISIKPQGTCSSSKVIDTTETWTSATIDHKITQGCDYLILLKLGSLSADKNSLSAIYFVNDASTQGYLLKKEEFQGKSSFSLSLKVKITKEGIAAGLGKDGDTPITPPTPGETDLSIDVIVGANGANNLGLSDPSSPDFFLLSDGTNLKQYDTEKLLSTRTGVGTVFDRDAEYQKLKTNNSVHWIVRNLQTGEIIAQSSNAGESVYGASVSKSLVAAAALEKNNGKLPTKDDWQALFRLLVNSENNPAWDHIQGLAGGKEGVNAFTQKMGYKNTIGDHSGNRINALEMSQFFYDVLNKRFSGAETAFKVMSACNTGETRGRKYIPSSVYMGGKTGTYNDANHDTRFLKVGDKWYSIAVVTTLGSDDNVAVMFGGLFKEYIGR